MKITLENYNSDWISIFQSEKETLQKKIKQFNPLIEHIGSTAVAGLSAKPVIDILIGIPLQSQLDLLIEPLIESGYHYIKKHEDLIPYRRFFAKENSNQKRTHHIHAVEMNSDFWFRHLYFRDILINNESIRREYESLKIELAKKEWNDSNEYAEAKNIFIRNIESGI